MASCAFPTRLQEVPQSLTQRALSFIWCSYLAFFVQNTVLDKPAMCESISESLWEVELKDEHILANIHKVSMHARDFHKVHGK